jgi:hypothetical protein
VLFHIFHCHFTVHYFTYLTILTVQQLRLVLQRIPEGVIVPGDLPGGQDVK